jgi:hypothetical protein
MIWFFERDGLRVRYEVRPAQFGPGFELIIRFPDGRQRCEVFPQHAALLQRQLQLEHLFQEHGWSEYADLSDPGLAVVELPKLSNAS